MADPHEEDVRGGDVRKLGAVNDRSLIGEDVLEQISPFSLEEGDEISPKVAIGGDKVVGEGSSTATFSGNNTPAGQVLSLINIFDRKTASRISTPIDFLDDAGVMDRAESQPLRLEPWNKENNAVDDTVERVQESTLKAESLKFPYGSISLQLNPDTLLHILQSFTQTNNSKPSISKKLPSLNPEARKTPPNTTSFHIYRSAPYTTWSLTRNFSHASPNLYPDPSKSQPLSLAFPIPTLWIPL